MSTPSNAWLSEKVRMNQTRAFIITSSHALHMKELVSCGCKWGPYQSTFKECWLCAISQCHLWCGMEANHSLVPHCHIWAHPSEVCNVLLFNLKLLHGTWDLEWKRWLCSYIWWLVGYADKHYKLDLSFVEMLGFFFFAFFFLNICDFQVAMFFVSGFWKHFITFSTQLQYSYILLYNSYILKAVCVVW